MRIAILAMLATLCTASATAQIGSQEESQQGPIRDLIAQAEAQGIDPVLELIVRDSERLMEQIATNGWSTDRGRAIASNAAIAALSYGEGFDAALNAAIDGSGEGAIAAYMVTTGQWQFSRNSNHWDLVTSFSRSP